MEDFFFLPQNHRAELVSRAMAFKILAIKLRAMGDTILISAPLAELSRAFPQAEIDILIPQEWTPLFKDHPGIRKVMGYPSTRSSAKRALNSTALGLQLRNEKYDCVVNFHASSSSAWIARMTGAKQRSIHFHGHHHENRFSTVQIPGKGTLKPIIERDMDAIRALGIHVPAGRTPKIALQPSEIQSGQALLSELNLKAPVLGLGLGASRPTKCWPIERFAALAIEWCVQNKGGVIALAGPHEGEKVQSFLQTVSDLVMSMVEDPEQRAKVRNQIIATTQLSLRKLASVLSQISVLAGNDSGPKHLAVAVGTPTVTLFGPEHPFEWHPYPKERHPYFFVDPLSCRRDAAPGMPAWCGLTHCTEEEHRCMRLIGTQSVLSECQRVKFNR